MVIILYFSSNLSAVILIFYPAFAPSHDQSYLSVFALDGYCCIHLLCLPFAREDA